MHAGKSGSRSVHWKSILVVGVILFGGAIFLGQMYSGYRSLKKAKDARMETLQPIKQLKDFELVSQDGKSFGSGDLKGHPYVAGFIFTRCKGPCPVITRQMGVLAEKLKSLPDIKLVTITVDPEYDTPAILKEYAAGHGADPGQWVFLTGKPEVVMPLIKEQFMLAAVPVSGEEQVIHSSKLVLVDGQGHIRKYYNGLDLGAPEEIIGDITFLKNDL